MARWFFLHAFLTQAQTTLDPLRGNNLLGIISIRSIFAEELQVVTVGRAANKAR